MTNEEMVEIIKRMFRKEKRLLEYMIDGLGKEGDRKSLERVSIAEAKFMGMVGAAGENRSLVENQRLK